MTLAQQCQRPVLETRASELPAWEWIDEATRRPELAWEPVLYLQEIALGGVRRRLDYPLKLEVGEQSSGGWEVYAPELQVGGFGPSVSEALRDLFETAWSLWESYSSSSEEELHPSAVAARNRLQRALGL
ncbi:MAG TPA: hypothetical protein DFS52_14915 [Myxococcales bacterium]|jgi:hypothetical protein|nr:hypothetical protein [Myxococcales bacterium]